MLVNNNSVKFKKAIEIREENLKELEEILLQYCDIVKYQAVLNDGRSVEFIDLAELNSFRNEKASKITNLTISSKCKKTLNKINMYFRVKRDIIICFSDTVEIEYKLDDEKKEDSFNKKVNSWFSAIEQCTVYNFLSKISSSIITVALMVLLIMISILALVKVLNGDYSSTQTSWDFTISVFVLILMLLFFMSVEIFWRFLFPPIIFLIGNEIKYNKMRKSTRNIVIVVILMGTLVSIGSNALSTFLGIG